jgi:SWI/SNF-related matrix-associated actin-dependent regulator of chromatin subfamily A3
MFSPQAHYIRRKSTTFYRSCSDLEARSRWCLTGTPIQNRLEDIGTLFAFLRAEPFHSLSQFRYWICMPFERGEDAARDRLILLYDSLVLRRTKDILVLPGHTEELKYLQLTEPERMQYQQTTKILDRSMRTQVGIHSHYESWKTSRFGLFQAHLQLRILCNHGTFQKPFSWKKRDLRDEREALVGDLGPGSEYNCSACSQPYSILATRNNFVEQCQHVLCHDCIEDLSGLPDADQNITHCPLCQRFQSRSGLGDAPGVEHDVLMGDDPIDKMGQQNHKHADYFRDIGFSTKIHALMTDVKQALLDDRKR